MDNHIGTATMPDVGLVGAMLGHVSRHRVARSGDDGKRLATAGIAVGWASTALLVLALAVPVVIATFLA